jgi:hypothetical protein
VRATTIVMDLLRASSLCLCLNLLLLAGETQPPDSKEAVVNAFMAARTLPDNTEARKLMTAALEGRYLRSKKLSTRVRGGRVAAFDYDPSRIQTSGEKEFQVEMNCVWADWNERAYETQIELLKFVKVRKDWLADEIHFVRSVPFRGLPPFSLEQQKAGKDALAVAKRFAKAIVNRDPKQATQCVTEEYQNQFREPETWEKFIAGPSAPHYAAYDLRDATFKGMSEVEVKIGLYKTEWGKRSFNAVEARLSVQEGRTNWQVDDFQLIK